MGTQFAFQGAWAPVFVNKASRRRAFGGSLRLTGSNHSQDRRERRPRHGPPREIGCQRAGQSTFAAFEVPCTWIWRGLECSAFAMVTMSSPLRYSACTLDESTDVPRAATNVGAWLGLDKTPAAPLSHPQAPGMPALLQLSECPGGQ